MVSVSSVAERTRVSVIIPAYNQGHFLGKAIESVLSQSYPHFEIVVVDDGSTDNTAEVACSYDDERIQYLFQENRGLSAARNAGLRSAQGEFISYLDSDDLFLPEKLNLLVNALQNHTNWGLVAGQAILIDENDTKTGKVYASPIPEHAEQLVLGNPLHVGSVLVRRDWQASVGEFDESLRSYEDWDMWLRLARSGCEFGWVSQPVSLYRFHSAQMTRIGSQMTQATFAVLDKVFRDPDLPQSWQVLKDQAYSNANLRAMAQAYLADDFDNAKAFLREAIRLNPKLVDERAMELSNRLSALADSPKTTNPVRFLATIYANLPDELDSLRQRAPGELSQKAVHVAMDAYQRQDYQKARSYIRQALNYQPALLTNRQVLTTLLGTYAQALINNFR